MKLRTPTNPNPRRHGGLSILELMIAVAIASLVFAAMASFSFFTARSFVATGNYADLDRASRNALDIMTRDIRESRALTYFSTNKLVFTANDKVTSLTFDYDKNSGKLTRSIGGSTTVLLEGCDFLKFSMYQRNPSNNFMFYPVLSNRVDMAKLIDVSWKCSRKILGQKVNTESVQTAKIVIRN